MIIRNKFSKKKIDKKNLTLNKIINIKKNIRKKTERIIPLTEMEKFLYTDYESENNKKNTTMPKGKYIKMNDVFLLNIISKKDCKNLYAGLINLYKDNYLKGYIGGEFLSNRIMECIYSYMSSSNHHKWSRLCDFSPKDKELYELCDFFTISIFEISNDLIGICFDLKVTKKFNSEINAIFNEKVNIKTVYDKYRYRGKYTYGKRKITVQEKRNNDFENYTLEFKCRFHKLFSKYLPLQLDYKNKPPISINTYQTNFNVKDIKEAFYSSLNILNCHSAHEYKNITICVDEKDKGDNFINTTMWYNIGIEFNKIDRSNSIFYYIDNNDKTIKHCSEGFVNMFTAALTFYLLDEMQEDITNEKNKLYDCKINKIKRNFIQYEVLNSKYHKYSSIFEGMNICNSYYKDDYLEKGFKHIKKLYNDYNQQIDEIRKEYEFRTNINNVKSSYSLSKKSIIIAIITMAFSVYIYQKDKNDDLLKQIKEQTSINNNEIKKTNDLINEIKKLIEENTTK